MHSFYWLIELYTNKLICFCRVNMNQEIFIQLDKTLRPLMHGELKKNFNSIADEHEEIIQDTFIKIFKELKDDKFKGKASLKNWAMVILKNTALDSIRRYKREPQDLSSNNEEELNNLESEHLFREDTDSDSIKKALKSFAKDHPQEYNDLLLIACSGLNLKQFSEMLEIGHGAARERISRYRKLLKGYVMKFCEQK